MASDKILMSSGTQASNNPRINIPSVRLGSVILDEHYEEPRPLTSKVMDVEIITKHNYVTIIKALKEAGIASEVAQTHNSSGDYTYIIVVDDVALCKDHRYRNDGYCSICDNFNELQKELHSPCTTTELDPT